MTPHLTQFIAEAKERCEAASPAPWKGFDNGPWGGMGIGVAIGDKVENWFVTKEPTTDQKADDGKFIEHARTDLPRFVAMLEISVDAIRYYASHGKGRHDCPTCDGGDRAEEALRDIEALAGDK